MAEELETFLLKSFFHDFGATPTEELIKKFPGAFLMVSFHKTPPMISHLRREEDFTLLVGGDDDADIDFMMDPTLEPEHCRIAWHPGFSGWTIEDLGTSFGTEVQGERLASARPVLLTDKDVIKVGGGLLQLQFYAAETLFGRMAKAGVTRTVTRLLARKAKKKKAEE
ncbi:MAG: FHA domain-containing protein [Planctomycetes bacterium]|nr:FHA domain-containing protein [Planctomycetota bacterium]